MVFQKIQEVLGENFKPKGGGLFGRAETIEHYIARALQKAAKIGQLEKVKF